MTKVFIFLISPSIPKSFKIPSINFASGLFLLRSEDESLKLFFSSSSKDGNRNLVTLSFVFNFSLVKRKLCCGSESLVISVSLVILFSFRIVSEDAFLFVFEKIKL